MLLLNSPHFISKQGRQGWLQHSFQPCKCLLLKSQHSIIAQASSMLLHRHSRHIKLNFSLPQVFVRAETADTALVSVNMHSGSQLRPASCKHADLPSMLAASPDGRKPTSSFSHAMVLTGICP